MNKNQYKNYQDYFNAAVLLSHNFYFIRNFSVYLKLYPELTVVVENE